MAFNLRWMVAVSLAVAVTAQRAETNRVISGDSNLSREMVADLKKISEGAPASESTVTVTSSSEFVTSLPVRGSDVYFLSLARQ